MRARRLPGLPVLALNDGGRLGKVKSVVVDPSARRVAALIVAPPGLSRAKILPTAGVHALGADAVTVDRSDLLLPFREAVDFHQFLGKEQVRIIGSPVFTAGGELVGGARDFEISGTGEIEGILVSRGLFPAPPGREAHIPRECIVALGIDAVIVTDEAAVLLRREQPESPLKQEGREKSLFRLFASAEKRETERRETEHKEE